MTTDFNQQLPDTVLTNTNYSKLHKTRGLLRYISQVFLLLCTTNCCASLPHKLLRKVSSSLTSPAQHLFGVSVVQSFCLPYCFLRVLLKITSGEGCTASRQGKQGSGGKLVACVFYQTMREC